MWVCWLDAWIPLWWHNQCVTIANLALIIRMICSAQNRGMHQDKPHVLSAITQLLSSFLIRLAFLLF
jgi:hypothetical protein